MAQIARIRFATYLSALADEIRKTRDGEKTKLKLMASAARLLEDVGYRELNVEDVCIGAGTAKGTFYIYFQTKDEFLYEIAEQYVEFERQFIPSFTQRESTFNASVEFIAWYEGTFEANIGVLRCIVQMGESDPRMRKIWHARNEHVGRRVVDGMLAMLNLGPEHMDRLLFSVRTVGGMLDQSLFNRFGLLTGSGHEQGYEPETLTRIHALLIYRSLYGRDPPANEADDVLALLPALTPISR